MGENGSGLSTLGVKQISADEYSLFAVQVRIDGQVLPNRKSGMGGARYASSLLETAHRGQGGGWTERVIADAGGVLSAVDSGRMLLSKFEIWDYRSSQDGKPEYVSNSVWGSDKAALLEHRRYPEKGADWPTLLGSRPINGVDGELLL